MKVNVLKSVFSPSVGKSTLRSMNGHRCLSCAAKISFFADVAAKRAQIAPVLESSVTKVKLDAKERNFKVLKHGTASDMPAWLFNFLSGTGCPRNISIHLGLDFLFFVSMCIANVDPPGKLHNACWFGKLRNMAKDSRNCVMGRLTDMREVNLDVENYSRDAESVGFGMVAQLRRLTSLFDETFDVPPDKEEKYETAKKAIFLDMERTFSNGAPRKVPRLEWDDVGRADDGRAVRTSSRSSAGATAKRSVRAGSRSRKYQESDSDGKEKEESVSEGSKERGSDDVRDNEDGDEEDDNETNGDDDDEFIVHDQDVENDDASYHKEVTSTDYEEEDLKNTKLDADDEVIAKAGASGEGGQKDSEMEEATSGKGLKNEKGKRKSPSPGKTSSALLKKRKSNSPHSDSSAKKD